MPKTPGYDRPANPLADGPSRVTLPFVQPLTEPEIRAAFVNSSQGEAKRLNVPRDLAAYPWADLDFPGWRDPQAPERVCLAAVLDGQLVAVRLRCPGPSPSITLFRRRVFHGDVADAVADS